MTLIDEIWNEFEGQDAHGTMSRLLSADWPGELSAAMTKPDDYPALLLKLNEPVKVDTASLQQSERVELRVDGDEAGVRLIQVTLLDQEFRDVFLSLCHDLSRRVLETETEEAGAHALTRNLARWLRMMKRTNFRKLNREAQIGLFGELTIMQKVLAPISGYEQAVAAWTGPGGGFHDFQLNGIGLEVKTLSATRPQTLRINSERQLDDAGLDALAIAHIAVGINRDAGIKLPDIVDQIRKDLGDGAAREDFDGKLFEVGYFDKDVVHYLDDGYTERSMDFYRVGPGFPRIIETDLPLGLGKVRYDVEASACAQFSIPIDSISTWLSEAPMPSDVVGQSESQILEFKKSGWKADDPNVPEKVINEGVIKSIAGLLNADGGQLVVGILDRADGEEAVVGIEPDLEYLNTDLDGYENRLSVLIRTHIGGSAVANTRISFVDHGGKTTCHIGVRPSTKPVWATSPAKKEKGEIFWVRQANSTPDLTGQKAVDYMREHFG